jgi:hypothetical protein
MSQKTNKQRGENGGRLWYQWLLVRIEPFAFVSGTVGQNNASFPFLLVHLFSSHKSNYFRFPKQFPSYFLSLGCACECGASGGEGSREPAQKTRMKRLSVERTLGHEERLHRLVAPCAVVLASVLLLQLQELHLGQRGVVVLTQYLQVSQPIVVSKELS